MRAANIATSRPTSDQNRCATYQSRRNVLFMDVLARALSLRVIFFSLLFGVAAYVLVSLVWSGVGFWFMWLAAAGAYAIALTNSAQMVRCDACSKRVKLGADRCHHCGYSRA